MIEAALGYRVAWGDTADWLAALGGLAGLYVVWRVSRAELIAQRKVAEDDRRQFAELVRGVGSGAAADIVKLATLLRDRDAIEANAYGLVAIPTMGAHITLLSGIDLNRMPNAKAAGAVAELRRLAGWGKKHTQAAFESWREHGALDPQVDEGLAEWAKNAQAQEVRLREALTEPAPPPLRPDLRILRVGKW